MTPSPLLGGRAGLTPLPARGAGRHPSVPLSPLCPPVPPGSRQCWYLQGSSVLQSRTRARQGRERGRACARRLPSISSACSKEGRDGTTSKLFPGVFCPGDQPPGTASPQHLCGSCSWGSEGRRARPPWDSISGGTGRGPVAQPRCKKLCPAREPGPVGGPGRARGRALLPTGSSRSSALFMWTEAGQVGSWSIT